MKCFRKQLPHGKHYFPQSELYLNQHPLKRCARQRRQRSLKCYNSTYNTGCDCLMCLNPKLWPWRSNTAQMWVWVIRTLPLSCLKSNNCTFPLCFRHACLLSNVPCAWKLTHASLFSSDVTQAQIQGHQSKPVTQFLINITFGVRDLIQNRGMIWKLNSMHFHTSA